MTEFATARRNMVEGQVRTADVTDLRILSAMLEIPRENFVPAAAAGLAYLDLDLAVGEAGSRRLLKPMVLAKLIHAADIKSSDRVLDVGCGTGYAAAVLARMASQVVALGSGFRPCSGGPVGARRPVECDSCERSARPPAGRRPHLTMSS